MVVLWAATGQTVAWLSGELSWPQVNVENSSHHYVGGGAVPNWECVPANIAI